MKALTVLTVLQALAVHAAPHRKRQDTTTFVVITELETTTVPCTTTSIIPQPLPGTVIGESPHTSAKDSPGTSLKDPQQIFTEISTDVDTVVITTTRFPGGEQPQSPVPIATTKKTTTQTTGTAPGGVFFESISSSTVTARISVSTVATTPGTAQILPTLSTTQRSTLGTVFTSLSQSGQVTKGPLLSSSITVPKTTISNTAPITTPTSTVVASMTSNNIFQPIATDAPPSVIGTRSDHPVARLGIVPQNSPIGTNNFYQNFFLGSQSSATWTHPYSVAWAKGGGSARSWGMSIQHIEPSQRVFGPDASANPVEYFVSPVGIQSIILSASELGASTTLTMDTITGFSANINLLPNPGAAPAITFPLVQGMGFITGLYNGGTPLIQTGVFFRSVTKSNKNPKSGITKYIILLEDGNTWLLYAYSFDGKGLTFTVVNTGLAQATSNFNGVVQIAKSPSAAAEAMYDEACGAWPTNVDLSGSTTGDSGSYTLAFAKSGLQNTTLAMFALPHHVESLSPITQAALTGVKLSTTTKGMATAILADSWTLTESLPTTMDFAPWSPSKGKAGTLSATAMNTIRNIAQSEVSQDMNAQSNLDSMYFSGKALAKFAGIVYTLHDLVNDSGTAQAGLNNLKTAFARFATNKQIFPLVHETAWGGVVSSASYTTGNAGADFGNTYYNDHHFHYGYFIYTAAVIGYLDPNWLAANKAFVNTLARDIANPSTKDNVFPVYRNFDWYHGHSWAHGLYESSDGRDQESTSEDSMSAYALKMWGRTIGDSNMEARSNLQLAVTARALQNYFLYDSKNTVQPANFIGNKVSGILFENKIDHTTYFGTNIEFIQGIHMLPLLPSSTLTRTKTFVQEEWDTYFSNGRADNAAGGWKGVLYANLAIVNPVAAWQFFSQSNFNADWIDGGASRTWYLALAAGLGGA